MRELGRADAGTLKQSRKPLFCFICRGFSGWRIGKKRHAPTSGKGEAVEEGR